MRAPFSLHLVAEVGELADLAHEPCVHSRCPRALGPQNALRLRKALGRSRSNRRERVEKKVAGDSADIRRRARRCSARSGRAHRTEPGRPESHSNIRHHSEC